MQTNRIMPEIETQKKPNIWLNNEVFDFVNKLKVGDSGLLKATLILNSERQDGGEVIKSLRIVDLKQAKKARKE